jgi:hypothetical protein
MKEDPVEGIMVMQQMRTKGAAAAAVLGLGAMLTACSRDVAGTQFSAAGLQGAPVSVSCEPNQRAVVRQVALNGGLQSQVQCETVNGLGSAFAPVGMTGSYGGTMPVGYAVPASSVDANAPTQFVRTAYPQQVVTRQVAPQQRVTSYQTERVQPKRSVKKSAIIIGSSAGVGAGIGAAVGGKKGAGIGALIGGGGAALWDQITRRK